MRYDQQESKKSTAGTAIFEQGHPALERRGILAALVWYSGFSGTRYGNSRFDTILWELEDWKRFWDWIAKYGSTTGCIQASQIISS